MGYSLGIDLGTTYSAAAVMDGGRAEVFTLVVSILYLLFAYGAWTLKPWGWTLGVGLAVASVVITLIGLTQGTQELVGALISLAISGVILYYLFQPDVKAAFGRT